jgi:hypothetical protein
MQVPILDSQIHIKQGYAPYDAGIQQNVFVKDIAGNNFVGQVCSIMPSCAFLCGMMSG